MNGKAWLCLCAIALYGCDDSTRDDADSTTGLASSTTDAVQTTIPVTSVTETTSNSTTDESTSTSSTQTDTDPETSSTGSSTGTEGSSSSTGGTEGESSSSTSGDESTTTGQPPAWDVEWCNLQFPPTIASTTATPTTAYARVYVEGLTDQTNGNDIDPLLDVEFGYGADESDPAAGDWTWAVGAGNPGWDGAGAGAPNNDEYQGDLQFAEAGTYDYAARVSGDGGKTWVYCDLDGLVEGGYTSDQAGDAVIQ